MKALPKPWLDKLTMVALVLIPLRTFAAKYIFNVLLARMLSVTLYGDFVIALTTFFMCVSLILLGTDASSTRFLAQFLKMNQLATAADYIRWNFQRLMNSSQYFIMLLFVLLALMLLLHYFNIKTFDSYHLTVYVLFLTPLGAVAALLASYLACNNNIVAYNWLYNSACYVIFIVLIEIGVRAYHLSWDYQSLWWLTFRVFGYLILIELFLVYRYLPRKLLKSLIYHRKYPLVLSSALWEKVALRLCFNRMVFVVICAVDLYAVKLFVSDKMATNQYAAVLAISGLLWLVGSNIYSRIIPEISHSIQSKDYTLLQQTINQCNVTNFLAITSGGVLIIYFAKALLGMFGEAYMDAASYHALIVLAVGYYIGTFAYASVAILKCSGNELWLIYIGLLELLYVIVSAVVLTHYYGIVGAAWASSMSITIATLAYIVIVRRKFKIKLLSFF